MLQDNLTRAKARDIIAEAREFFYCQQKVSIEAWGNIYAEMMDKLIRLTMLTVKDVKDGLSVGKLIKDAWDIRGGNKTQEEQIPFEVLNRPIWTIYTSDITILGYPKANRNIIKDLINSTTLELSEKEKQIIHREADILPFKLFPNVEEGSRKS